MCEEAAVGDRTPRGAPMSIHVHLVQCKMCPSSCPLGPVQDVTMFLSTHDHSAQCALCTVYLPTEQAEKYLKIYVLICHLTYICPSLFSWKENMIFEETVIFKLNTCASLEYFYRFRVFQK